MKQLFFSEVLNQAFESEADCVKAEKEYADAQKAKEQLKATRAERAKELEEAMNHASELLNNFVRDYGAYHSTMRKGAPTLFDELVNLLF